jgi:hypothetical protein
MLKRMSEVIVTAGNEAVCLLESAFGAIGLNKVSFLSFCLVPSASPFLLMPKRKEPKKRAAKTHRSAGYWHANAQQSLLHLA